MATNAANRSGRRGVDPKWCAELRQALALANREGGVYSVQARTPSNSIVKFVLLKQRDEHQQQQQQQQRADPVPPPQLLLLLLLLPWRCCCCCCC